MSDIEPTAMDFGRVNVTDYIPVGSFEELLGALQDGPKGALRIEKPIGLVEGAPLSILRGVIQMTPSPERDPLFCFTDGSTSGIFVVEGVLGRGAKPPATYYLEGDTTSYPLL